MPLPSEGPRPLHLPGGPVGSRRAGGCPGRRPGVVGQHQRTALGSGNPTVLPAGGVHAHGRRRQLGLHRYLLRISADPAAQLQRAPDPRWEHLQHVDLRREARHLRRRRGLPVGGPDPLWLRPRPDRDTHVHDQRHTSAHSHADSDPTPTPTPTPHRLRPPRPLRPLRSHGSPSAIWCGG